ncbi:heavy metal translocating P-type ATPase [Macrococcoides caseolyticum]|uniref:heavy metal translocating P-type ATPase n=1 Tax=Macrococcoides caseolyticum TaxID=69966 RepID=UPI001F1A5E8A|nr:heavy metal translocating P-type ATPase [Macrococcus caseolyticus]MCE4957418.1 cadmium-translocating P-type ATPase [Macrococcus caseolyticus]
MTKAQETYRIEGLSCTNCAAKFVKNIEAIPGVEAVDLNFGAAKLNVTGDVTIEALEEAGKFDHIKVRPAHVKRPKKVPFYKDKAHLPFAIALVLFIAGLLCSVTLGEDSWYTRLFYICTMVIGGYNLFIEGIKRLFKLHFDMNVLMTVAIIGATLIGEVQEGAMVVLLFAVSEALESYAMEKSRESIQTLINLSPEVALKKHGEDYKEVAVQDLMIGDIVRILPGKKVPIDGTIISGQSNVNQASITGESIPVTRTMGDEVFSGTLNESALLEIRVTKHAHETKLAKMIHLVEEAQSKKAPTQRFVDQFAKYYTPVIMLIAFLVMVVPPLFGGDFKHYLYQGLSVLVVGCPCALVVSTPVAIVTAIGSAARRGILIKGGIHLEHAGRVDMIAMDKTGTLTKGTPVVTDRIDLVDLTDEDLNIVYTLERDAGHPLSKAIVQYLRDCALVNVTDYEVVTARGVQAMFNGIEYRIGQRQFFDLSEQDASIIDQYDSSGTTQVLFGTKRAVKCIFFIQDTLRDESKTVIETLNQLGIRTMMLTGDNKHVADAMGRQLGITQVHSELLPEDKLALIKDYQQKGHHIAMVGDGVNDAPALAQADIGFSMGGAATDTAIETADITFMKDNLSDLPKVIKLSQRTLNIIKQNIGFALGLKLIAILLVIPGWLTLWIAIFADMGATLIVTLNSLRLLKR